MSAGGDKQAKEAILRTPFMAFVSDDASVETAKKFALSMAWPEQHIHKGTIHTATDFLRNNPSPEVLLVDIVSQQEAADALDKLADVCDPGVKVIACGNVNEYSFYIWLTEIGLASYVLKPFTVEVLEAHYQKTVTPEKPTTQTKDQGKAIAVIGARGGVGATTVATNLGWLLSHNYKKNTGLMDMDAQLGSVSVMLDLDPTRGLRDAMEKPERVDALFIERVVTRVDKDLAILSAEESLSEDIQIKEQSAVALMKEMRAKYQYSVIDVPRFIHPFNRNLLKLADKIIIVAEQNLLSLRDTLRLLDLCKDTLKVPAPLIVSNRVGLAAKQEMSRADFEKAVGAKISVTIPFAAEVNEALAGGDALVEKFKQSPATRAIVELAGLALPELAKQSVPPASANKPATANKFSFGLGKKK